jgi:hypothetical protein
MHGWKKHARMKKQVCMDEKQACPYVLCCGERVASNLFWIQGVQMNSTGWFYQEHTCSYEERIVYIVCTKRVCSIFSLPKVCSVLRCENGECFLKSRDGETVEDNETILFQS